MATAPVFPAPTNLASREFKADPYPFYAWLRAEAPVYRTTLPDRQVAYLVTRYADVLALLRDGRFAKDRANAPAAREQPRQRWVPGIFRPLARTMLDLDDPDHARLRGLVHKVFTPRFVEQRRARIVTLVDELLDTAQRKGSMDLIADFALPLPVTVIADLLGVPPEERHLFQRWTRSIVAVSSGADNLRAIPSLLAFLRYLRRVIKLRRARPGPDLISSLIVAQEAGETLNEDELLGIIFLLLVAGHETTVNLIGSGMLALLQNPAQLALLRDQPTLIGCAVEELLRYTSPVEWATERYAREDVTIAGVTIPQGALVLGVIASANRDEGQFSQPNRLDLAREPNKHMTFGQGGHYCLGAPLARLEAQIALTALIARFPAIHTTPPGAPLYWRRGLFLRGLETLAVAW